MKILLIGRNGQVGRELARTLPALGEVRAVGREELDLSDAGRIAALVRQAAPQVIVNAAAYTAVDRAESERELAFAVNAAAPGVLADEASRLGALLVHYSTDYVFDGSKRTPYAEGDPVYPLSAYGETKLAGERAVQAAGCRHIILRTAWVYSPAGRSFVGAILRQASNGARLSVVNDQFGAPTAAADIARLTVDLLALKEPPEGLFHATAAGETTWYEVAREILRLKGMPVEVAAVTTAQYGARAVRPAYSVLDNSLLGRTAAVDPIGHWRERLAACLRA